MTPTPPHARSRTASSRGFVLPMVLLLTVVATMYLTAAFQRQSAQARTVERQIADYRRHHEMFGVRAIVAKWLRDQDAASLSELVTEKKREFAFGFILPGGAQIRINVKDGQGVPLATTAGVPDEARFLYSEFLGRIPREAHVSLRKRGEAAISLDSAPEAVLEALVTEHGDRFARRIIRDRKRRPINQEALERALRSAGLSADDVQDIRPLVTFTPSLWRLDLNVKDQQGRRRFIMLLQFVNGLPEQLEWYETAPKEPETASNRTSASRRRRAAASKPRLRP